MRAIVWTKYGSPDGLQLQEVATPTPKDNEILIKVHAATASTADTEFRRLKLSLLFAIPLRLYLGFRKPTRITILGIDFAGVVEAVGGNVKQFKPGDEVFGGRHGAFAEYVTIREGRAVVLKSANVTFEQAAAIPAAALTALQGLRDHGQIQPGQQVLINGATGGVGTFAVQLAKSFGADL